VSILEDQIQGGAKALVVAPAGSAQVVPILQNAVDRKIPVILVDTDAPLPGKASYAGTDNRAGGALAARHVIERLSGGGKVALIDGRTVEPRIDTGTELVTSANAAGYKK